MSVFGTHLDNLFIGGFDIIRIFNLVIEPTEKVVEIVGFDFVALRSISFGQVIESRGTSLAFWSPVSPPLALRLAGVEDELIVS